MPVPQGALQRPEPAGHPHLDDQRRDLRRPMAAPRWPRPLRTYPAADVTGWSEPVLRPPGVGRRRCVALLFLPLGPASTLQLLGPVTLALCTSRRLRDAGFAALAGCGVWLFHTPGDVRMPLPGVLLALAAGASMAGYLLLSKRTGDRTTGGGPLALAVTWAALLTVPIGVADQGAALLAPRVLATGLVVAVLSAVGPYSPELAALRRLPARAVSVLTSLEPASAGLAGVLVLGEHLVLTQWAALGCVGVASTGAVSSAPRRAGGPDRGRRLPKGAGAGAEADRCRDVLPAGPDSAAEDRGGPAPRP
ncbi:DMT family transporter [Streptomyces albus]